MGIAMIWDFPNTEYRKVLLEGTDYSGEIINMDVIDSIDDDVETKIENLAKVYQSINYDLDVIQKEIKRLKGIKDLAEKNKQQLKEYIQFALLTIDKKVLETPTIKVSLRNNPAKLIIDNEDLIPKEYRTVKTVFQLDTQKIKKSLDNGKEVEGCSLMKNQTIVVK